MNASNFASPPELHIKYSKLIDPFFIAYSQSHYPDWTPPSQEEVIAKVKLFQEVWSREGAPLLEQVCAFMGFGFRRDILDVYIVSGTPRDMSDPLILKSRYEPDEFIDAMLHELLHRLLVINGVKVNQRHKDESRTVKNHISVFAALTHIYRNILDDERRLRRIIDGSHDPDYKRAWDIVKQEGYEKLVEECKSARMQTSFGSTSGPKNHGLESAL
jgi:hypothetical protein